MCREEAQELNACTPELQKAGATKVVCLLKENLPAEVAEFRQKFWPGEIMVDESHAFYTAVGGGQKRQSCSGSAGFLGMLANPFSSMGAKVRANIKRASDKGVPSNFNGEGYVHGGLYVVRKDGAAQLKFIEEPLGNLCPLESVLRAVGEASGQSPPSAMGA